MAKTLLISDPSHTWREWLKQHRGKADLLCLDPNDPNVATPGQFALLRGNKQIWTRFYGSLDAQRYPHVTIAALAQAMHVLEEDAYVQLFAYRPVPLLKHVVSLAAQVLRPDRILIAAGTEIEQAGFPVGPEEVELEAAFPTMVQQAQRKAQWMKLLENCEPHVVPLDRVSIEGARIGSGHKLSPSEIANIGLQGIRYAEKTGGTLLLISDEDLDEGLIARALDITGTTRAALNSSKSFANLLCSFASQEGEDFGMGTVQSIDWEAEQLHARCTAVPPAPVRILRLGALRVDPAGNELGEVRPWQL